MPDRQIKLGVLTTCQLTSLYFITSLVQKWLKNKTDRICVNWVLKKQEKTPMAKGAAITLYLRIPTMSPPFCHGNLSH